MLFGRNDHCSAADLHDHSEAVFCGSRGIAKTRIMNRNRGCRMIVALLQGHHDTAFKESTDQLTSD